MAEAREASAENGRGWEKGRRGEDRGETRF
jgi:hypothetical protein